MGKSFIAFFGLIFLLTKKSKCSSINTNKLILFVFYFSFISNRCGFGYTCKNWNAPLNLYSFARIWDRPAMLEWFLEVKVWIQTMIGYRYIPYSECCILKVGPSFLAFLFSQRVNIWPGKYAGNSWLQGIRRISIQSMVHHV
jgi:hypothetical protein